MLLLALAPLASCADSGPEADVAALFADPGSARFQSVRQSGDFVCGEVNARTPQGSYSGYKRFVHDRKSKRSLVDPGKSERSAPAGHNGPDCSKAFAYQTSDERFSCAYAPVQQQEVDRQRQFEELWASACGSGKY